MVQKNPLTDITKNRLLSECKNDKHKPRNNKFGITWCVKCGRLFNKPGEKDLQDNDKVIING